MIKTLAWWIIAVLLAMLVGCGPREYYKVPAQFCTEQYTGRTRDTIVQTGQVCGGYDSNNNCIAPIPIYGTQTEREVNVTCAYSEWR